MIKKITIALQLIDCIPVESVSILKNVGYISFLGNKLSECPFFVNFMSDFDTHEAF